MHSLEHGHTILWYDDTVKPGTEAYDDIQPIAEKFGPDVLLHGGSVDREATAARSRAASTSR